MAEGGFWKGGAKGKIHVLSWNVQGNLLPNLPTIHSPLAPRRNWHRHVHRFYCIILIFANKHTCTFKCYSTRLASPQPPMKGNAGRLKASGSIRPAASLPSPQREGISPRPVPCSAWPSRFRARGRDKVYKAKARRERGPRHRRVALGLPGPGWCGLLGN